MEIKTTTTALQTNIKQRVLWEWEGEAARQNDINSLSEFNNRGGRGSRDKNEEMGTRERGKERERNRERRRG